MIRIRASDLDSWLYYQKNEDMTAEELLKRLRREEPPTSKMLAGTALHSLIEAAKPDEEIHVGESQGHTFRFADGIELPYMAARELRAKLLIAEGMVLVGVADGFDGSVREYKLTERFDAEHYMESYQWRAYAVMFGANKIVYDVFVGREDKPRVWTIFEVQRLPLYAYPGIERDVRRVARELGGFMAENGLEYRRAA